MAEMPKCILDPARDCIGLAKAEMIEKQFDEYKQNSRKTHEELFKRVGLMEQVNSRREEQYNNILKKLDEMSLELAKALSTITELKDRPAKRWDSVIDKIILLVLTGCVGFVMLKLGIPMREKGG